MAGGTGSLAPAEVYSAPKHGRKRGVPVLVWVLLIAVAAVCGFFVGRGFKGEEPMEVGVETLAGHTSITEAELDGVVASYRYDGETYNLTAREAMAHESSLDALRNADGSYAMPSAESILSAARTAVLMRDVEAKSITVSDEELASYAEETFGTSDIASLASTYTMDEEATRERLRESCALAKLRATVEPQAGAEPAAPAKPADDKKSEPTAEYAAYIIALAGDEWNAEQGSWASEDGPFATALREYDVRSDRASYAAAQTAYNVAYQLYSDQIASGSTAWTDYVNALLCDAELTLSSLVM